MSKFTSFAIIGSGNIGSFISSAFAAQALPQTLIVLSRNPESKQLPPGVKGIKVADYGDVDSVAKILAEYKVDVVVSTVNPTPTAIQAQKQIADAAKKAGVKLFVPSEFGSPTDSAPSDYPPFQEKDEVAKYIQSIGLPWTRFYTGAFISSVPLITGVRVNGKINIGGKGQSPISFTSVEDVGGFVAHVLSTQPLDYLSNKMLRLEGDRASLQDIARWYNKEVAYVQAIPGPRSETLSILARVFECGAGSTGWSFELGREGEGEGAAGSANKLWQGHQWKKIRDVIAGL